MSWILVLGGYCNAALASPGDIETLAIDEVVLAFPDARSRLEHAADDLPGILRAYRPAGVGYSDYQVIDSGPRGMPRMSFVADVEVLGIHVKGLMVADVSRSAIVCDAPSLPGGYRFTMDFQASDQRHSDQMSLYTVDLCASEGSAGELKVGATATTTEGPRYRFPWGIVSKNIFRTQLKPVLQALLTVVGR
ncbi:hypothetical protein WDW37_08855 [Bdellovibrionota bacterium FG-1]